MSQLHTGQPVSAVKSAKRQMMVIPMRIAKTEQSLRQTCSNGAGFTVLLSFLVVLDSKSEEFGYFTQLPLCQL